MNKKKLIVTMIMMLLLTGCSLAKPEKMVSDDNRMAGVFITIGDENQIVEDDTWTTRGTEELTFDVGTLEVDKKVLIGTYDEKEDTYRFGDHPGFLLMEIKDTTKDYPAFSTISDLEDVFVDKSSNMKDEDTFDTEVMLEAILYLPETLQDKRLHFYNIFQSKDGTIFLDGTGNSLDGATDGGRFDITYEYKTTSNGKGETDKVDVHVNLKLFKNSKEIFINQYDAQGNLLERKSLGLPKENATIAWVKDASFAIVEEVNDDGCKREMIVHDVDEEENPFYSYCIEDKVDIVKKVELTFE